MTAAAGLLLALAAPIVAAYEAEVPQSVTVTAPTGTLPCRSAFPVSATILDTSGTAVPGVEVTWTLKTVVSSQDAIVDVTTTSDANGVATTSVYLDCIVGERQVEARAGTAIGGAVLGITTAGVAAGTGGTGGLPNTSTPPSQTPPLMLAVAGFAVVLGGVMGIRSIVAQR
jgi:hypothetical protein